MSHIILTVIGLYFLLEGIVSLLCLCVVLHCLYMHHLTALNAETNTVLKHLFSMV